MTYLSRLFWCLKYRIAEWRYWRRGRYEDR